MKVIDRVVLVVRKLVSITFVEGRLGRVGRVKLRKEVWEEICYILRTATFECNFR